MNSQLDPKERPSCKELLKDPFVREKPSQKSFSEYSTAPQHANDASLSIPE